MKSKSRRGKHDADSGAQPQASTACQCQQQQRQPNWDLAHLSAGTKADQAFGGGFRAPKWKHKRKRLVVSSVTANVIAATKAIHGCTVILVLLIIVIVFYISIPVVCMHATVTVICFYFWL